MVAFNLISETGILLFSPQIYYLQIYYFINGIATLIRTCVAYNYLLEFLPISMKNKFSTIYFVTMVIPTILYPLYFIYISNNALYFQIPFIILSYIGSFLVLLAPESPKYYFFKNEFKKAEIILKTVTKFNGLDSKFINLSKVISNTKKSRFE